MVRELLMGCTVDSTWSGEGVVGACLGARSALLGLCGEETACKQAVHSFLARSQPRHEADRCL
jgi:hypothetical protein